MEDLSDAVPDVDVAEPIVGPPVEENHYVAYYDEEGFHDGYSDALHDAPDTTDDGVARHGGHAGHSEGDAEPVALTHGEVTDRTAPSQTPPLDEAPGQR